MGSIDSITRAYDSAEQSYTSRNPTSLAIYNSATACLPGGNTRTVLYYAPFPLSITHAHGARLHDADGHAYLDLLGEYTAGLYGHSEPLITAAIKSAVDRGLSFGSQHEDEVRLAEAVKARFPAIDLLRTQRVCRSWYLTSALGLKLQQRLFLSHGPGELLKPSHRYKNAIQNR